MNVTVSFRHMDTSEAIKRYAHAKVSKLQKFLRQPMTAKVTLSLEKLRHVAETKISSGGAHHEAREVSADIYASIDRVADKLERQIRGNKGAERSKKRRGGATLRGGKKPEVLDEPVASSVKGSKKRPKKAASKTASTKKAAVARGARTAKRTS